MSLITNKISFIIKKYLLLFGKIYISIGQVAQLDVLLILNVGLSSNPVAGLFIELFKKYMLWKWVESDS